MYRLKRLLVLTPFLTLAILLSVSLLSNHKASALSGSEFQAGRIMDDGVFFNAGSMSEGQIQEFLNAKLPVCDTNGDKLIYDSSYGDTVTRKTYAARRGVSTPFICLKDYRQDTGNKAPEDMLCNGHAAGNKSSARIIKEVADSCGVSPKVLVVLLQKEQSLVTDDWPWPIQYRSATGYGCPDTAPCDAQYYGFFNQVYNAARIYKYYAKYPNSFNHLAGRNNSILYHPNSACGRSTVFIQNQATAGLYNYTPYQPNAAALNNLYGTGDGCSAYGNRNFWRMFSDWFGTTLASDYFASPTSQSSYPALEPGAQTTVYMSYKNWGSLPWYDSSALSRAPAGTKPVHLATARPLNRNSSFAYSWPSASRPAVNFTAVYESNGTTLTADQHVAQPGQIVKFSFVLKVPSGMNAGTLREFFQPIVEGTGSGLFNDTWTFFDVTVLPKPAMAWHDQSSYPTIVPSDKSTVYFRFKNTGNVTLYDDKGLPQAPTGTKPLHLATKSPLNRSSDFGSGWISPSRPAVNFAAVYESNGTTLATNQHIAKPGQIVKFSFTLTAPEGYAANTYMEDFQPLLEGTWDGGLGIIGAFINVTVPSVAVVSYTALPSPLQLTANLPGTVNITVKNSGNVTLPANTKLMSSSGSNFKDSSWQDSTTIYNAIGSDLASLQSKNLSFTVLTPNASGNIPISISLQGQDGLTVSRSGVSITTNIAAATYKSSNIKQSPYPAYTYGQTRTMYFMYKNTGNQYWYDSTSLPAATTRKPYAVHLATNDPLNRSSRFAKDWPSPSRPAVNFAAVYESDGTTLTANQHLVKPGQIAKYEFETTPSVTLTPGTYREFFQPVAEGTADGKFPKAWTFFDMKLLSPTYIAGNHSQSAYPTLTAGQQTTLYFMYKNNGTAPWYDSTSISQGPSNAYPMHLATSHNLNRVSAFKDSSWATNSRPAVNFAAVYEADGTTLAADQHVAQPGQIVRYSLTLKVPVGMSPGTYREFFQPVAEGTGNGLFSDTWTFFDVTVQ